MTTDHRLLTTENIDIIWQGITEQSQLWLMVFAIDSLRYLLGAGSVYLLLYWKLAFWSQHRRTQQRLANTQDRRREFTYSLLTTAIYASLALFTVAAAERGWLQHYQQVDEYGWTYTLLSLPLLFVLHDTYFYWLHRAMHHPRSFRWVHRIHHLSRTPTPWAAYSFAPPEALLMGLFAGMAV